MPQLRAETLVELIATVDTLRALTKTFPELKPVAEELWRMVGPLPTFGRSPAPAPSSAKTSTSVGSKRHMSAARRKALSLTMKKRWAAKRKEGKKSL